MEKGALLQENHGIRVANGDPGPAQYMFIHNSPVDHIDGLGLVPSYAGTKCPVFGDGLPLGKIRLGQYAAAISYIPILFGEYMSMGVTMDFVDMAPENIDRFCCKKLRWILREQWTNIKWDWGYTTQIIGQGGDTAIMPTPGYYPGEWGDFEPYYFPSGPPGLGPKNPWEDWPRTRTSIIPEGWTGAIGFEGTVCLACEKTGRDYIFGTFCMHWQFTFIIRQGNAVSFDVAAPSCNLGEYVLLADLEMDFPGYRYKFK